MWTINSNDVMQAKGRIERRRTEIETRYAEEKEALDAEFAVIETLERAASEFAVRHIREDHQGFVSAPPPPAEADPPGGGEPAEGQPAEGQPTEGQPTEERVDLGAATAPAVEADPPAGDEVGGAFDILKPGSRWRLNRGNRLSNADAATTGNPPTTW